MHVDEQGLLASLEAQGNEFLKSFGDIGNKRRQGEIPTSRNVKARMEVEEDDNTDDEWTGFDFNGIDDILKAGLGDAHQSSTAQVIVFSGGTTMPRTQLATKAQSRAFMSSKIAKLKEFPTQSEDKQDDEAIEEASNVQNDALLHRLVHTQLLSGSLNPELNMTPAHRRKALAGRVRELAGDSKLGHGETVVRQEEKQKAHRRIRDGMTAKQKERDAKSLNDAKNAGNYHPALKKIFTASSSSAQPRKRTRGLKMGVGKFSGGILKLTPGEIDSVKDSRDSRSRGRSRSGRGGLRGRRSGR